MLLSVLLVTISSVLTGTLSRRLIDDIDNEIGAGAGGGQPANGQRTGGGVGGSNYREPVEWVKISAPPKPVVSKVMGSYVELECEAMGSPVPSVRWLKGRTRLTENQSYESNLISENPSQSIAKVRSRVVINFLLPIHSGRFTCVAESGAQIATTDTTIYVIKKEGYETNFTQLMNSKILGAYYAPRITLWTPTYMDEIGTNVVLPCQTIGNPKPTLTWFDPQGQIINNNHGGRVSILPDGELSIRSLTWADMGEYNCVVQNKLGQDSVETFLYPMKPIRYIE